jgi:hypothetical protein
MRFLREINGEYGEFCKREAQKRLAEIMKQAETEIIVEEDGAVRWVSSGNYLPEECCEMLEYGGFKFSRKATYEKSVAQLRAVLLEARRNPRKPTIEEMCEMRNAFGHGATVVDVVTGRVIRL